MLPFFLLRRNKYAAGFKQRFGILPEFKKDKRPVIWIHCVSVGETNAARPLVTRLLKEFPHYRLVVSTTTKTGQDFAKMLFANDADLIFYFPFDWRWTVRKVLRKIQPKAVLIMETELWLNFLRETHKSGSRIFIVNGRLSEKSTNRYALIKKTMKRTLRYIDTAFMQTSKDAKRLVKLGINIKKVKVTGNFKFDQQKDEDEKHLTSYFKERFYLSDSSNLIIAASTHEPEEHWILDAFKKLYMSGIPNLPRLMLVPRHPERFAEVEGLIENTGFKWVRRTDALGMDEDLADVILLDSVGELRAVYPLAEIVFVGGSLIPHGGQNILEPALEKKAIVTGHFMTNFQAMANAFSEQNAIVKLPKLEEDEIVDKLAKVFEELLIDENLRKSLAENAYIAMGKNRGATEKTVDYLKPYLQVKKNFVHDITSSKRRK